jgi:predicted nucleic acid-binding protein
MIWWTTRKIWPPLRKSTDYARETARHLGLRYIGLIGALVMAKRKGLISAVKPHLDMLRDIAGFRVDAALYTHVLKDQNETGT